MQQKASDFLLTTRTTDYESMIVQRGWTPWAKSFGPLSRTSVRLLMIAALVYGAWTVADLLRPTGSDADALPTISAGR